MTLEMLALARKILVSQYHDHEIDADTFASLTEDVKLAEMRLSR